MIFNGRLSQFLIAMFYCILVASCSSHESGSPLVTIEQLQEIKQGRVNSVLELRYNASESSKSLLLLKVDGNSILTNLSGNVLSQDEILSISNISDGVFEMVAVNPVDENLGKIRLKYLDLRQDNVDESLVIYNNKSNFASQAKTHIVSSGEMLMFARINYVSKLIKYKSTGQITWKKVLVPKVQNSNRSVYPQSEMQWAVSPTGNIAVVVEVFPNERQAFKSAHNLTIDLPEVPYIGASVLMIIDAHGNVLNARSVENVAKMVWADSDTLMLVSTNRNKATLSVIKMSGGEVALPLQIDSSQFMITALAPLSGNRALIGGFVDFKQASTGSITEYGKAFLGVYDLARKSFVATRRLGDKRSNLVSVLEPMGNDRFLMATQEDAPKTHDSEEDRYSKAVLYRVSI